VVVSIVPACVVVAACSGANNSNPAGTTAAPATPTRVRQRFRAGAKYVALGSSFAAGPGIPNQVSACGRSDHNYPSLVAASLRLALTDVSCSGATIANILSTAQGGAAPQIDSLSADTSLVTVTVGGNDIEYSAAALACAATAARQRSCGGTLDRAAIDAAVSRLPDRLTSMLDAIKLRAPDAVIVLVTYPKVVPTDANSCARLGLLPGDAAFVADLGSKLEMAFQTAANRAQIRIVDPYRLSDGHGPCAATSNRWVEGANPQSPGFPFHPDANGHMAMAKLVVDLFRRPD
jgi:lysophospholipase L1-like esterase